MKWFAVGAVVIVLAALYLILTQARTRGDDRQMAPVAGSHTASSTGSHKVALPPTISDNDPHEPSQAERGSAGHVTSTRRQEARTNAVTLPATIEEAVASNPALAKDLACRDEQAKFNMDHQLRMIGGIRDCLAGRTSSTGRIEFMLRFDNNPETRRAVGTAVDPLSSELAPEDDKIVLECVKAFHVGGVLLNSEKYGKRTERHHSSGINLPLEDSYIYKMVREGSFTAGTNFGCEVP